MAALIKPHDNKLIVWYGADLVRRLASSAVAAVSTAETEALAAISPLVIETQGYATSAAEDAAQTSLDRSAAGASAVSASASRLAAELAEASAGVSATEAEAAAEDADDTLDAISAALAGYPDTTPISITVPNRATLAGLAEPSSIVTAHVGQYDEAGPFSWLAGDQSAKVAADPEEGVYVAPSTDTTGASGAWIRINELKPSHFNAVNDAAVDSTDKLQAFYNAIIEEGRAHDVDGAYGVTAPLVLGPDTGVEVLPMSLKGNIHLTALAAMDEMVRMRNLSAQTVYQGMIRLTGTGTTAFAGRSCMVGLHLENCSRNNFVGSIQADNFSLAGVWCGSPNNNLTRLGSIKGSNIGSGVLGHSLSGNWSLPINSGSSGSTSQATQLSVDAMMAAEMEAYLTVGSDAIQVRLNGIGGQLYYVQSVDRGAGTISVYPWIDPALGSSGTIEWCIGALLYTRSGDGNLIGFDRLDGIRVGRILVSSALYGTVGQNIQGNNIGTAVVLGATPSSAHLGTVQTGHYEEGGAASYEHVVVIPRTSGSNVSGLILGESGGFDMGKCWSLGDPRVTAGTIAGGQMGSSISGDSSGIGITAKGRLHSYHKQNIDVGLGSGITLAGHARPPVPVVMRRDVHTLTPAIVSTAFNRLFGYSNGILGYIGSGPKLAPTGAITFNAPTKAITGAATTSGSAVVTLSSTSGLITGMPISGTGVPVSTTILTVNSATQITMSANATATGTATLTFTGSVNGSFANTSLGEFKGPPLIVYDHADKEQMQWTVAVLAGAMEHGRLGTDTRGNVSATLNLSSSKMVQRWDTTLTAARTATLPAPGNQGRRFRIYRAAGGAFDLTVRTSASVTLRTLTGADQWVEVEDDGTEYRVIGFGP